MEYKQACPNQYKEIAALALRLWPEHRLEELEDEFKGYLADGDSAVFLAEADGGAVAFAQCGLRRDYVEGTDSSPVGYLEGIYVLPEYRKKGVGRALVAACENWSRQKGCQQMGSDCTLDNLDSLRFHLRSGFSEAGRIICFVKELEG